MLTEHDARALLELAEQRERDTSPCTDEQARWQGIVARLKACIQRERDARRWHDARDARREPIRYDHGGDDGP